MFVNRYFPYIFKIKLSAEKSKANQEEEEEEEGTRLERASHRTWQNVVILCRFQFLTCP